MSNLTPDDRPDSSNIEPQPRGARHKGNKPIDQAEAAKRQRPFQRPSNALPTGVCSNPHTPLALEGGPTRRLGRRWSLPTLKGILRFHGRDRAKALSTIINPTLAMAGALKETALIRTPARTKQNDQHSN
jgi:hypothetical protein